MAESLALAKASLLAVNGGSRSLLSRPCSLRQRAGTARTAGTTGRTATVAPRRHPIRIVSALRPRSAGPLFALPSVAGELAHEGRGQLTLAHHADDDCSSAGPPVTQERLESWLQRSAAEIIGHLDEAPFFHLIFDHPAHHHQHDPSAHPHDHASSALQHASSALQHATSPRQRLPDGVVDHPESWTAVRKTVAGDNPDGMILVHRLDPTDLVRRYGDEMAGVVEQPLVAPSPASVCQTGVWGLVVLGRSSHRHACFILKTTRCSAASSLAATRFSITRARCFGPSVHQQLENAWLASR